MIKVANAPCSWGIIENIEGERYTYDRVLNEIEATGYVGTELGDWGFMPTEPDTLTKELQARNLDLLASWVSVYLHDASKHQQSIEETVRTAKLLAAVAVFMILDVLVQFGVHRSYLMHFLEELLSLQKNLCVRDQKTSFF